VLSLWLAASTGDSPTTSYKTFKKSLIGTEAASHYLNRPTSELTLPAAVKIIQVLQFDDQLKIKYSQNNFNLTGVHARLVQPAEFNALLEKYGNKGQLLSQLSLLLIHTILEKHDIKIEQAKILVFADKQGGRKSYAGLIAEHFPQGMPKVLQEEQVVSRYELGQMNWQFSVGSERYFPVAVASMFAKYLRELEMKIFNEYWSKQIPGIKPTAGYPVDAKRFFHIIEQILKNTPLTKNDLWREK
jgi:hypothetical protein